MQVRAGFGMDRNEIRTRIRKRAQVRVGGRNHQMDIHEGRDVRPDRRDNIRPDRQVRHEMTIHGINVDPVGTFGLDGTDLSAEICKIRRQDRRRDLDGSVERHGNSGFFAS